MSTEVLYIIIATVSIGIGIVLGIYIQRLRERAAKAIWSERQQQWEITINDFKNRLSIADEDYKKAQLEKELLGQKVVRLEGINDNLNRLNTEQKEETTKLQERFTKEFENLAHKILEQNSSKFTEQNQKNITQILSPLQEKIQLFEKKVDATQKENISIHSALKEQLLHLQNQNVRITQEAENLTKALKGDSKMQGNWGELVLERVLEKSGLEKDREYTVQKSFDREDGSRVLPDVVINLPDGKKMIIDSKVSLTDYERYVNAEEEFKPKHLKDHISSLRRHVARLSAKKYEDLYDMESPDFVLLFVPIEPAFAVAINQDSSLYNKAFEQNIVIVTPATLLATLRTIDSMWNNEKQQRNAIEIARQAGALYDKFEGFVSDLSKLGKKMDDAKSEYRGAMNKLTEGRGNIITSIEKLKSMGAKAKKSIPEKLLKKAEEESL
jgi:DNA recombination protein RmuC